MKKLLVFCFGIMASIGTMFAESGTCGENLTWNLTDGVLTISGSGYMTDYASYPYLHTTPWTDKRDSIKMVIINDGATNIGGSAFYYCINLISVTIPNSVSSIGKDAFNNCGNLVSITIPDGVTYIGESAFGKCNSLLSLAIPNGVTTVKENAFDFVPNIIYSGSLDYSTWGARCVNGYVEGDVVYSNSTKTNLCACSVTATGNVNIPNSVTSIAEEAFYNCYNISTVSIPKTVSNIGYGAFNNVLNITYTGSATGSPWGARCVNGYVEGWCVYENINKKTLCACSIVASGEINIPTGVTKIGNKAFYNCNKVSHVTIPNSVTSIEESAFYYCALTTATIPNSVTSIGEKAFAYCYGLTSASIPNSVKSIANQAFLNCISLTSIVCETSNPPTCGNEVFYNVSKSIPLYVPANSIAAYKEADTWKEWGDNIKPIQASEAEVIDPSATPTGNSVIIDWPKADGAVVYTITIKKGDEVICTLEFNEQGQLLNIAFAAPARDGKVRQAPAAQQTTTGWKYTITGLELDTEYSYTVIAKNSADGVVYNKTIPFKTKDTATGVDQVPSDEVQSTKVIKDGQLYIMNKGQMYNVQGQEVK